MWKIEPPTSGYYAVIFSSKKSDMLDGYKEMDEITMQLAQEQEGFLGYESCNNGASGIFISYWKDMESINLWKENMTHIKAKSNAKRWYERYLSQICKVKHSHLFENK